MLPTPEQTTRALKQAGLLPLGSVQAIQSIETFEAYADVVARLKITYDKTTIKAPETLVCKVFGTKWYEDSGKAELSFYQDLAPQMPDVPVPNFYGHIENPERNYLAIFIEDLQTQYHLVSLPIKEAKLDLITDTLVSLHARWWEHDYLNKPLFLQPDLAVTRMPQDLPSEGLATNVLYARLKVQQFLETHDQSLVQREKDLLLTLVQYWQPNFQQRIVKGHAITLIHGDVHLLGNVFFANEATTEPKLKLIDWTQAKRGLGVHDLMYALLSVEAPDRVARDKKFIERYYQGLLAAGIRHYSWEQCLWDYRFSLLSNVFQSVFQDSVSWFRKTCEVIDVWQAQAILVQK